MRRQERVVWCPSTHDLDAPPAFRLLDVASEVGELAKAVAVIHGPRRAAGRDRRPPRTRPATHRTRLLALADELDTDAGGALAVALSTYERRLAETADPTPPAKSGLARYVARWVERG